MGSEAEFAFYSLHELAVMLAAGMVATGSRRHVSYVDEDELDRYNVPSRHGDYITKVTVEFVPLSETEEEYG
jgi:hypothetical protein